MPKQKVPTARELSYSLVDDYRRWRDIYLNGSSDPFWEDGCNLELVRNHIIHDKKRIEEVLGDKYFLYPDAYFYPLPESVDFKFMAVDRFINCRKEVLKSTRTKPYESMLTFTEEELYG